MSMKFTQLSEGQQFEYQGKVYTRSGPLMAADAEGNTRMIPRSAEVTPIGATIPAAASPIADKQISTQQAVSAFDACQLLLEHCLRADSHLDVEQLEACLRAARDHFLQALQ